MQETENTVGTTEEVINETIETTSQILDDAPFIDEPKVELTPDQQVYEDLKVERMGKFKVGMSYEDARYYRNLLDKATFKGPQQAYLLIVAKGEMSAVCDGLKEHDKGQRYEVDLTSACIESVGFFMNSFESKGGDSAMKLFSASMLLRPAMGLINELDAKLEEAKNKIVDAGK